MLIFMKKSRMLPIVAMLSCTFFLGTTSCKTQSVAQSQKNTTMSKQKCVVDLFSNKTKAKDPSLEMIYVDENAANKFINSKEYNSCTFLVMINSSEQYHFQLKESNTMSEELAKKYPTIKSFKGVSVEDKNVTIRADFNQSNINIAVKLKNGDEYLIQPTSEPYVFKGQLKSTMPNTGGRFPNGER